MSHTVAADLFDRDASDARRATDAGPVFITDEGQPAQVLLGIGDYRRLIDRRQSIAEALAMPEADDVEFDFPKLDLRLRPAEFD